MGNSPQENNDMKMLIKIALARVLTVAVAITPMFVVAQSKPSTENPNTPLRAPSPFDTPKAEGWFWYHDPSPEESPTPKEPPRQVVTSTPATPARSETLKEYDQFKQSIEDAKDTMIASPTPDSVRHYVELQTKLVKRASEVADAFQRVVWANPQFDFTQQRPVVNTGLRAYDLQQQETRRQTFDRLAQNSMFYFFFRGDCPYCHAFAPTLESFSQATGIHVFPISVDGGGLPQYPNPHADNGIGDRLGVTMVPALFLATPATGDIVPVGFGALSDTDLGERLISLANPGASQDVSDATPVIRGADLPLAP
jgi:conjugal transfer pilus assembly protein TraF